VAETDEKFAPEKYGMMFCPDCDGQAVFEALMTLRDANTVEDLGSLGRKRNLRHIQNGPFPNPAPIVVDHDKN